MLFASIFHKNHSKSEQKKSQARRIILNDTIQWILLIETDSDVATSIIETGIVDILMNIPWREDSSNIEEDFSYALERINIAIKSPWKNIAMNILVWIFYDDVFSFSSIWNIQVILAKDSDVSEISNSSWAIKNSEFLQKSSWNIDAEASIFISNTNISEILSKDELIEIGVIKNDSFTETIAPLIEREKYPIENIIRIKNESTHIRKNGGFEFAKKQYDLLKPKIEHSKNRVLKSQAIQKFISPVQWVYKKTNEKHIQITLFISGMFLCILLLYYIIDNVYTLRKENILPQDNYNKLIEAQNIIETASKSIANKEVFSSSITKAKKLVEEVKASNQLVKETQDLDLRISTIEKQFNGIETIEIEKKKADIVLNPTEANLVEIFEYNKKLYVVWKDWIMGPYALWNTEWNNAIKIQKYPDSEEAIDAAIMQNGNIYILTKTNRILAYKKWEFSYINIIWQDAWENAIGMKTFNENMYLISGDKTQIYRHKPSINWFSQKNPVIENGAKNYTVLDIGIDGAFYVLKNDLMVEKIITSPKNESKWLKINGIPGGWYTIKSDEVAKIIIEQNLNYFYIIVGKKVWIFKPDSKNYKDVSSLQYVGQIEIQTNEAMNGVFIPFDGAIRIGLQSGVYTVNFDVVDWKLILK